jgi:putative membrane protein
VENYYRYFLSIHIIAVISWMAGILYLFRLFVYHAEEKEQVVKDRFIVMERRLSLAIMIPAHIVALLMGILMLIANPSLLDHNWMRLKILLALLLIGMTHSAASMRRKLASGENKISSKTYRILNEIPTILMIGIVFLVILKPFS